MQWHRVSCHVPVIKGQDFFTAYKVIFIPISSSSTYKDSFLFPQGVEELENRNTDQMAAAASDAGKANDAAATVIDKGSVDDNMTEEERRERAERKRLSLAAQKRFKERLERRLHGMDSPATPAEATQSVRQRAAAGPAQLPQGTELRVPSPGTSQRRRETEGGGGAVGVLGGWSWTDCAICMLVLGICLILFRRLNWLMGSNASPGGSSGVDSGEANLP